MLRFHLGSSGELDFIDFVGDVSARLVLPLNDTVIRMSLPSISLASYPDLGLQGAAWLHRESAFPESEVSF